MRPEFDHKISFLLEQNRKAVLSTCGTAGVQAGLFPFYYQAGYFFALVPSTADILDNLSAECDVQATAAGWQLCGEACLWNPDTSGEDLPFSRIPAAEHCSLVKINPRRIQLAPHNGWGFAETIDFE